MTCIQLTSFLSHKRKSFFKLYCRMCVCDCVSVCGCSGKLHSQAYYTLLHCLSSSVLRMTHPLKSAKETERTTKMHFVHFDWNSRFSESRFHVYPILYLSILFQSVSHCSFCSTAHPIPPNRPLRRFLRPWIHFTLSEDDESLRKYTFRNIKSEKYKVEKNEQWIKRKQFLSSIYFVCNFKTRWNHIDEMRLCGMDVTLYDEICYCVCVCG